MYSEEELIGIAKRENNNIRRYLVVNKLQAKHVPVSPRKALMMFQELANLLKEQYSKERLLLIGFAETATAIGSAIAIELKSAYMQTTREVIPGVHYLFFSEAHSHATEQKLIQEDMDQVIHKTDRIIFIEDEITTGNTIMNIVLILKKRYPEKVKYSVASLLNGMEADSLATFKKHEINVHYLLKTKHDQYTKIAEGFRGDGTYVSAVSVVKPENLECKENLEYANLRKIDARGWLNARRAILAKDYSDACNRLWQQINHTGFLQGKARVLVLGTEEFMYPALYIASKIEENASFVRCHSTTRSPIVVSNETNYPLHKRYELLSFYDRKRTTYLYDLDTYDSVIIVTDSHELVNESLHTLLYALKQCGNDEIILIRWCE